MPLLTFPPTPTHGQLYPSSPLPGQSQYQWDSAEQTWRLLGVATGVVAGTYGDALNVGQFTVDATGSITFAQNVAISAVIPDLQTVTTQGAVTTDIIDVGGLVASGLTYPVADGGAGDYLYTDGAGALGWVTPPTETLQSVTNNGAVTTNGIDVAGLTAASLTYPLADGAAKEVITTDGAGNLGWLTTAEVVPAPSASVDPGAQNQIAFSGGNFYFHDGAQWWQVAGVNF